MQDNIESMFKQAKQVQANAHAPYSNFKVACCILSTAGNYYVGVNVENSAYPASQCAESSAIGGMISSGDLNITELLVIGGNSQPCIPCGMCLQKISEFSTVDTLIHVCNDSEYLKTFKLKDLLTHPFHGPIYSP